MIFSHSSPFIINADTTNGESIHKNIQSDFFKGLIADILKFFENGVLPFDSNQTLEVMTMRDALISGENKDGEWIEL